MTSEEIWNSIEKLSELRSKYNCFDEEEQPFYHALSLGIKGFKALEQKPSEDCISREQAIKATYGFERYTGIDEAPYEYAESILRELPSVRPQR